MLEPSNAALEGPTGSTGGSNEGGMAAVYVAEGLRHDRNVALKVLKRELAAVGADRVPTSCCGNPEPEGGSE